MRINTEASTYGAGSAYVICNGTVRDIVQQEAEWGQTNPPADNGGAHNCSKPLRKYRSYTSSGVSYYTYQLRLMFINSAQARTISDICPIQISTNLQSVKLKLKTAPSLALPLSRTEQVHSSTLQAAVGPHITLANSYLIQWKRSWNNVYRHC